MELRVLVVDDEPNSRAHLTALLREFPDVAVAGTASGGEEAVLCLRKTPVDLVFLDIEMADVNGFELARHIRASYPKVMIVFLTGHVDFALDGYEFRPLDFLIKPVKLMRLERVLTLAKEQLENRETKAPASVRIGLQVDGGLEIIDVSSILYLEREGRKVSLVSTDGKRYTSFDSLQKLQGIFEPYGFFRCHQSFLVRLDAIRGIRMDVSRGCHNILFAESKDQIPLSRSKYAELRERLAGTGLTIV